MEDNVTTAIDAAQFKAKYGPWAVISGASDGTGAAFARQLAEAGLNLVLIARRMEPLEALALDLQARYGIQTRVVSIDLFQPDAGKHVLHAAAGLEVGLYVSNAGADPNSKQYLDLPFETWRELLNRNVIVLAEAVHGFATLMKARGRGGLIMMSSGVALGGAWGIAVYSSTKAFDLNLAESLWMELKPHGIDVISAIAPVMDTPLLRRVLNGREIPGIYDPAMVTRTIIDRLGNGPCCAFGPDAAEAKEMTDGRRKRVEAASDMLKMFFNEG